MTTGCTGLGWLLTVMLVARVDELPLKVMLNLVERLDGVPLGCVRRPEVDGVLGGHVDCGSVEWVWKWMWCLHGMIPPR
jgi:hypothetical protein